jgi:multidrug efflux pump subunit AcrA (membrane-fusion protein)
MLTATIGLDPTKMTVTPSSPTAAATQAAEEISTSRAAAQAYVAQAAADAAAAQDAANTASDKNKATAQAAADEAQAAADKTATLASTVRNAKNVEYVKMAADRAADARKRAEVAASTQPFYKKPLFWGGIGGGAVVITLGVLLLKR